VAWAGFALSLAGVGLVTGGRGGGASAAGDGLVLASLVLSAAFTVAQVRLLRGRDPIAITAVQFLGAALAVLPFAALTEGRPAVPGTAGAVLAIAALAAGGTLLPFALFAYAQSRVPAEVAGAFLNIEPLVGAVAGAVFFGNPAGPEQAAGGAAILTGIALSSVPLLAGGRAIRGAPHPPEGGGLPDPRLGERRGRRRAGSLAAAGPLGLQPGGEPGRMADHGGGPGVAEHAPVAPDTCGGGPGFTAGRDSAQPVGPGEERQVEH
jgi:hypothetical protein